jgi:uncharacterized NAD(P)/FAD-binding protein YdhS
LGILVSDYSNLALLGVKDESKFGGGVHYFLQISVNTIAWPAKGTVVQVPSIEQRFQTVDEWLNDQTAKSRGERISLLETLFGVDLIFTEEKG